MKNSLRSSFTRRQVMRTGDFELYYYHDRTLSQVSGHTHAHLEMFFFLEGNVSYEIEGEFLRLKPGDILVIPPGTRHRPVIDAGTSPYRRFVLWINAAFLSEITAMDRHTRYLFDRVGMTKQYLLHPSENEFQDLNARLLLLTEERYEQAFASGLEGKAQLFSLLVRLNRISYQQNHPVSGIKNRTQGDLFSGLCNYINSHLEDDLSLDRLSSQFYVSKYYISHEFKNRSGVSVHRYITAKRLAAARSAILGGIPLNRAASEAGFTGYTSFYRAFLKEYGMGPREFSNLHLYRTPQDRQDVRDKDC